MLQNIIVTALFIFISGISSLVFCQTPAALKPVYIAGDLVAIAGQKFTVASKVGNVDVFIAEATAYKRVQPDNISLGAATAGQLSDIGVGDKLTISALPGADGKTLNARTVYYSTKADIAAKNAKEAEAWRTRGIAGRVVSVDAAANKVAVELRSMMGSTNISVEPKQAAKFLRYAPDSVRYDEAQASSIGEIKAGDMIRALGDRSADGTSYAAEQVLTGAFQTIAGTVKSVDVEKNEVVIRDLQAKKDVTVVIGSASVLKMFPAEMAQRMAGMQAGGGGGVRPPGQAGPPQGGAAPPANGTAGPRPGGPRPAGGIDDMLERFPDIKAGDLKVGDMIAISSTKNGSVDRIKAIKLLAGVEPFLRAAQASGGQRPGQGVQGGFSIPGLDGIGFP